MFSREESKQIRKEFWTTFGKQSLKKWILYDTKIKEINLKFHFDTKKASVGIIIDTEDELIKEYYFEKFESLKNLLLTEVDKNFIFDPTFETESGKIIANIYLPLENVTIHNKKSWPEVFQFFNKKMLALEHFFIEYYEFIKQ
ncbi:DUF4268 domain-containing protein [Mesonia maritima]|uniref:DUF4268 domain-containing protein n=1 Tax=Mesonia maritima TaxID=1793873 RepID=A0ABU1K420_9FLAO|nr:DUF4268 domain-containing protein [Mesonia maritima]MDR6300365.1 hypothetical protein [Mesonia maritima]